MISFIKGELAEISVNTIVVEANGIGYELTATKAVLDELPPIGTSFKVYTYLQVKEDGVALFGFASKRELSMFKQLITVNGIGPKGAVAILSSITVEDLSFAILSGDAKTISNTPGIGKKTAEKLILELKDKVTLELDIDYEKTAVKKTDSSPVRSRVNAIKEEAAEALVALGYSKTEALKTIGRVEVHEDMTVEELLKLTLKNMG